MDQSSKTRHAYEQALELLPGGVNTNVRMVEKPHPLYLTEGKGSKVYDLDGREYIDFVCGFGPVVLGHAPEEITAAVTERLAGGQTLGATQPLEVEVARQLRQAVPALERIRLAGSGSEAVHAALRLARAFTGRHKVVKFEGHYHGWLDGVLAGLNRLSKRDDWAPVAETEGIPPSAQADLLVLPWNDEKALTEVFEQCQGEIAAVIMEPIMGNAGCVEPRPGYLQFAKDMCQQEGALLIFDEVITGFRVDLAGAQGYYGIQPDLAVFGKAIAAGFPIGVFGGRADVMDLIGQGRVNHSGTFNGNVASVSAAEATLKALTRAGQPLYEKLRNTGKQLMAGLQEAGREAGLSVLSQGPGPVFWLWFTDQDAVYDYRGSARADYGLYERFGAELIKRGVRVMPGGRWYVNAAHDERDIARTIEAAREAFTAVASAREA